jgi:hypothetical protein
MRCISCGEMMRLVQAVSDRGMMVSGYEHLTYECIGCHEVERRLTFTTAPSAEQAALPPPPAPPAPIAPPPEPPTPAPPSAWELAQGKVQARQADLQDRAELARQVEAADRFERDWEALVPVRPKPVRPQPVRPQPVRPQPVRPQPVRPEPVRAKAVRPTPVRPLPVARAAPTAAPSRSSAPPPPPSPLERVAAKIRDYAAKRSMEPRGTAPQNPQAFSRFDRFRENPRPAPAALARQAVPEPSTPPEAKRRVPAKPPRPAASRPK